MEVTNNINIGTQWLNIKIIAICNIKISINYFLTLGLVCFVEELEQQIHQLEKKKRTSKLYFSPIYTPKHSLN